MNKYRKAPKTEKAQQAIHCTKLPCHCKHSEAISKHQARRADQRSGLDHKKNALLLKKGAKKLKALKIKTGQPYNKPDLVRDAG